MKINFLAQLLLCVVIIQGCKEIDNAPPPEELPGHKGNNGENINGIDMKLVAQNFVSPIGVVAIPDHSKRLAVIGQIGKVWIIDGNGNTLPMPFLDVSARITPLNPNYDERGLLGPAGNTGKVFKLVSVKKDKHHGNDDED